MGKSAKRDAATGDSESRPASASDEPGTGTGAASEGTKTSPDGASEGTKTSPDAAPEGTKTGSDGASEGTKAGPDATSDGTRAGQAGATGETRAGQAAATGGTGAATAGTTTGADAGEDDDERDEADEAPPRDRRERSGLLASGLIGCALLLLLVLIVLAGCSARDRTHAARRPALDCPDSLVAAYQSNVDALGGGVVDRVGFEALGDRHVPVDTFDGAASICLLRVSRVVSQNDVLVAVVREGPSDLQADVDATLVEDGWGPYGTNDRDITWFTRPLPDDGVIGVQPTRSAEGDPVGLLVTVSSRADGLHFLGDLPGGSAPALAPTG